MSKAISLRQSATFRWSLTILWSILTILLFLTPSGDGTPVTFISQLFGGTTITDAIGHVIINGILGLLWLWTIKLYLQNPTRWVISVGLTFAILGEILQLYIPGRGGSLLDMAANSLGILIGIWIHSQLTNVLADLQNEA